MKRLTTVAIVALLLAACGDEDSSETDANMAANNMAANNMAANNMAANNMAANNQVTNAANAPACDPTFAEADACGGSPVGSWAIADACAEPIEVPSCPGATVTVESSDVSGTLVVTDSNWAYNASGTVIFNASIPASCVAVVGDCAAVEGLFGADCTDAAGGACDCTLEDQQQIASSGSYTIDGGNTAVVDDGSEWLFCVDGDGVTLKEARDDAPVFTGGR